MGTTPAIPTGRGTGDPGRTRDGAWRCGTSLSAEPVDIVRFGGVSGVRSKLVGMAYEIPVTQARAELADLINRVVYGGERVVVTRHGKPLVALVSAADLERLEELREPAGEQVVSSLSRVREATSAPRERQRFGIAAEHQGPNVS